MTAASLEPVRAEVLRRARADADAAVARAEADAARWSAKARAEAAAILADAAALGEADARRTLGARAARARRTARAVGLRARRDVYEAWHEAVRAGVRGLRQSPQYPELLARLADRARVLLGESCTVEEDPRGGLRAQAGTRSVDLTLDTLAARAAAGAEGRAAHLWTE